MKDATYCSQVRTKALPKDMKNKECYSYPLQSQQSNCQLLCMWEDNGASNLMLPNSSISKSMVDDDLVACWTAKEISGKIISLQWRWRRGRLSDMLPPPKLRPNASELFLVIISSLRSSSLEEQGNGLKFLCACHPYL